jgi:ribonuclease P protein component
MGNFLFVKYKKRTDQDNDTKIIVSLKVSKKAVDRNKIKRRIRETLRKVDIKKGIDLVVITNKEILEKSFLEVQDALISNLTRLGLITRGL